jgi:hypothetical protein
MGRTTRLLTLLFLAPAAAAAQGADSAIGSIRIPVTDSARRLPADRSTGLISWIPGGSIDINGRDAWHGRTGELLDRSVDGIGWGSLIRSGGSNSRGPMVRRAEPAFNAIDQAVLHRGAYDATRSAGGIGLLGYTTLGGGQRWTVSGTAESEAPVETEGGPGISRFEASAGGPLGGGWRVRAAATLTGRQSMVTGVGYGDGPYYVPTGIDTSLTFAVNPPLEDTVTVAAQTFGSTTAVPYSPRTTSDLFARVDGTIGKVSLWGRYLFGGDAERLFAYEQVSNTGQTFVRDGRTQDLAIGASLTVGRAWRINASLAWQEERAQEGPIDLATEPATRDPALGILGDGVDLMFDMANFPVDDELMWNYRLNKPGSRRSPYDLENTAQYALVDAYRNNAYGLLGFSETGGPVGQLKLYRDRRASFSGSVAHPLGGGSLEVGGELRQHDIQYYSHSLTSQAFSDVWLVKPTEQALFANWAAGGARWRVAVGLRLDRFNTGARRPRMLPRLTSYSLTYVDPESGDTLRWGMSEVADSAEWYEKNTDADDAHVALSPRLAVEGEIGAGWTGHASLGRLARTPDLAVQLSGLNTDLAITNTAHVWGTDYGHELTDLIEAGVKFAREGRWIDLTVFQENHLKTPSTRFNSYFDPARLSNTDIRETTLRQGPTYTGLTLSGALAATRWLTFSGAFTHISSSDDDIPFQASDPSQTLGPVRPNTFVLTAEAAPVDGMLHGFGAIVSWRQASGMAYTIPTQPFWWAEQFDVRSGEIPAWRSLDLRLTKSFDLGGSPLTLYLDGRNVLNVENLLTAFDVGDPRRNPGFEADQWSADSNDYAREAIASGRYDVTGDIDLSFGGISDPRAGCGTWVTAAARLNPVNCVYLLGAEARFGDGDHIFTLTEQRRASMAYYRTYYGTAALTGPPQTFRIGAQIGF